MPGAEIQPINQSGLSSGSSSQSRRRNAWDNDKERLWKHSESSHSLQEKEARGEEEGGGICNTAADFAPAMPSKHSVEEEGRQSRPSTQSSHRSAWEETKMVVPQKKTLEVGRNGNVRVKSVELHEVDGNEMQINGRDRTLGMSCLQSFQGLSRVFRSKKFKSYQLETLYQRYFFSLNKSSLFTLLILLIVIVLVILSFHYASRLKTPYKGIFLGISLIVFIAVLFMSTRNSFSQLHLSISCYVVLVNISLIIILDVVDAQPSSATTGVWTTAFFIYMVYTLLPIRMRIAVLCGFFFGTLQILCALGKNYSDSFLWEQVRN